jgi:hypothetical protein
MATEMILVPKTRYERLVTEDKEHQDKLNHYITLLRDNGINDTDQLDGEKDPPLNVLEETPLGATSETTIDDVKGQVWADTATIASPMNFVAQLQEKYKLYGKRLLEYIKKHGEQNIGWDDNGLIIYNGKPVPKTAIIPLVEYIFKNKGTPPNGIKQFKKGLKEIRTPKAFLKPFLLKPPGIASNIKKNWTTY